MSILSKTIDTILHFDRYLPLWAGEYGTGIYIILFLVVFCETGLVITPFLPGDSLLFIAGALAGSAVLDIQILLLTFLCATLLGDQCNYGIGRVFGRKVLRWGEGRALLFNQKAFDKASQYFVRWGGVTMLVARFIPIVRTFAPFVAGFARMRYANFALFDSLGALLWVLSLCGLGYFIGNLPLVQENLSLSIAIIIALSLSPIVIGWVQQWRNRNSDSAPTL